MASLIEKIAREKAGFREKYAMDHGVGKHVRDGNHHLICYTYSEDDSYQDANGAAFDVMEKRWVR